MSSSILNLNGYFYNSVWYAPKGKMTPCCKNIIIWRWICLSLDSLEIQQSLDFLVLYSTVPVR
jgi:hypothetical protein